MEARMAPNEDDHDQMSFADLDHLPKPGRRVHDLGIRVIESTSSPNTPSPERNRKVLKLRWLLWTYVRIHEVGHEFQAIDFSHWASAQPQYDDDIDLRSSGGMFRTMVNAGVLEQIGFRNNGGNKKTGYHGTPRAVYRTAHLDYSLLGWPEDLSGIEQDGVWTDDVPPRRKVPA
jgi:hypothetical protein